MLARKLNVLFYETSALTSDNVEEVRARCCLDGRLAFPPQCNLLFPATCTRQLLEHCIAMCGSTLLALPPLLLTRPSRS